MNAVKDMISRFSHELEGLRTIVASHEKKPSEMGIAVEPYAEQLDRNFGKWFRRKRSSRCCCLTMPGAFRLVASAPRAAI